MKFFVPDAENGAQAERIYEAFAKFIIAPINDKRIWKLRWSHNGMNMRCEVGMDLPPICGQ